MQYSSACQPLTNCSCSVNIARFTLGCTVSDLSFTDSGSPLSVSIVNQPSVFQDIIAFVAWKSSRMSRFIFGQSASGQPASSCGTDIFETRYPDYYKRVPNEGLGIFHLTPLRDLLCRWSVSCHYLSLHHCAATLLNASLCFFKRTDRHVPWPICISVCASRK